MTRVEATYLAWLDGRDATIAAAYLREGLALSAGADFGDPGYLRINFARTRATLQEALRRRHAALG